MSNRQIDNSKQSEDATSLLGVAWRTFGDLEPNRFNTWMPVVMAITVSVIVGGTAFGSGFVQAAAQIVATLLSFNGALLGLMLTGLTLIASLPNETLVVFSVTNKPRESKHSFLKRKLLVFLKSIVWLLVACVAMVVIYCGLMLVPVAGVCWDGEGKSIVSGLVAGAIGGLQTKAFIELKVFIFTIYSTTFTHAQILAMSQKKEPIDKSNA